MKKIFTYLFTFIFFFNQISYSESIKSSTNVDKYLISCNKLDDFKKLYSCLYKNLSNKNLSIILNNPQKKDKDLQNLFLLAQLLFYSVDKNLISNKKAYKEWDTILESAYKKKIKKKEIEEALNNSNCLNTTEFDPFISCFYGEFRNMNAYKNTNIETKRRIEGIMINVINLKDGGDVFLLDKKDNVEELFQGQKDGFNFFLTMMNGLGTDFYKKRKFKDDLDYEKIMLFIATSIIISLVAKKVLAKSIGSKSSSTGSANINPSSSGTKYSFSSQTSANIVQKPWFRYAYRYGFY